MKLNWYIGKEFGLRLRVRGRWKNWTCIKVQNTHLACVFPDKSRKKWAEKEEKIKMWWAWGKNKYFHSIRKREKLRHHYHRWFWFQMSQSAIKLNKKKNSWKKHNISVEWWSPQIIIVKIFIQGLKNCKISMNFFSLTSPQPHFLSLYISL